jgi:hypothetical protein
VSAAASTIGVTGVDPLEHPTNHAAAKNDVARIALASSKPHAAEGKRKNRSCGRSLVV